ncbi:MAG: ThiJ/PfpI family protein [Actinomycetia bacterium]|nr:ThiJ/PfpI family protein [Actinomycetes bacterium]
MVTTGILLFDDAEELDFAGPWEVLTSARKDGDVVVTVAEHDRPIRSAKGLRVVPDHTFDTCPELDVLVVPGGQGTRREDDDVLVKWLAGRAERATWVTSVCTGAFLLWKAGVARGRTVTTHWAFVEALRSKGDITVVDDQRWVVDGNLVTAAGVSAGIDMSLWLVGQLYGEDHARDVQHFIEYYPEPPFTGRR